MTAGTTASWGLIQNLCSNDSAMQFWVDMRIEMKRTANPTNLRLLQWDLMILTQHHAEGEGCD